MRRSHSRAFCAAAAVPDSKRHCNTAGVLAAPGLHSAAVVRPPQQALAGNVLAAPDTADAVACAAKGNDAAACAAPTSEPAKCDAASTRWEVPNSWLFQEHSGSEKEPPRYNYGALLKERVPSAEDARSFSRPRKRGEAAAQRQSGVVRQPPARQDTKFEFFGRTGLDLQTHSTAHDACTAPSAPPVGAAHNVNSMPSDAARQQAQCALQPCSAQGPSPLQPVQNAADAVPKSFGGGRPQCTSMHDSENTAPASSETALAHAATAFAPASHPVVPRQATGSRPGPRAAAGTVANTAASAHASRRFVIPRRQQSSAVGAAATSAGEQAAHLLQHTDAPAAHQEPGSRHSRGASAGSPAAGVQGAVHGDVVASGWTTGAGRGVDVSRQALDQQRARRQLQDAAGRGEE